MPPSPMSTLVFAAAMGMLWLSVAPLVSGSSPRCSARATMATLLEGQRHASNRRKNFRLGQPVGEIKDLAFMPIICLGQFGTPRENRTQLCGKFGLSVRLAED